MASTSALPKDGPSENLPELVSSAPDKFTLSVPGGESNARPVTVKHMSAPAYQSPLRHHHRAASKNRAVKETLNARSEYSNSEDDGAAMHRINQYIIKQEIGRGSFGAVHLAVDQYGQEYAVKEFSKSRLRKRAQSNLLRRPGRRQQPSLGGSGFSSPFQRNSGDVSSNPLDLIKEEIAIMKKLDHPNLVSLIEVLDDPDEDSLYMVMEMCKKGVVMHVGLDESADPYEDEKCRCWFRDMILGIEYLHAQGIIHRDLKPDNCLITEDDVLKIVDFGVSEMFEKNSEMNTAKSAGSPAFMPPELCVAKHGQVSGKAVDIWSMGVTLYCLKFGRIPFEKMSMIELYESIRNDQPYIPDDCNENLKDLFSRILEKDPSERIKMPELREHPWVTNNGTDPLLSFEENTAVILEPPTEEELNNAITGNLSHLFIVMKAVKRFKQLLFRRRPGALQGFLGSASRMVQPPLSIRGSSRIRPRRSHSAEGDDRRRIEGFLATEGVHRDIPVTESSEVEPEELHKNVPVYTPPLTSPDHGKIQSIATEKSGVHADFSSLSAKKEFQVSSAVPSECAVNTDGRAHVPNVKADTLPANFGGFTPPRPRGQAHDPLEDTLFLDIGADPTRPAHSDQDPSIHLLSESPGPVDINVYEKAYREEIERIMQQKGRSATLYLTRRVERVPELAQNECLTGRLEGGAKEGLARLAMKAKEAGKTAEAFVDARSEKLNAEAGVGVVGKVEEAVPVAQ